MGNGQTKERRPSRKTARPRRKAAVIVLEKGEAQLAELIKTEEYLLLDFCAPWCPPCRALKPTFEALAQKHGDALACVAIDVDENETIADEYGAKSIPFLVLVEGKTGKTIATKKSMGAEQLEAWVTEMTGGD
jgi:thioredoxin 1